MVQFTEVKSKDITELSEENINEAYDLIKSFLEERLKHLNRTRNFCLFIIALMNLSLNNISEKMILTYEIKEVCLLLNHPFLIIQIQI